MGLLNRLRRKKVPLSKREADRLVLRRLQARGADLTKPRHILHFLYFPDGRPANDAAAELEQNGYRTTVAAPEGRIEQWSVRAETERVVDWTTVEGFRTWFERFAEKRGGEYDGWEAAAEP